MRRSPKLWPSLAALITFLTTMALGQWQLDRAHGREAVAERYRNLTQLPPMVISERLADAAALDFRRIRARGNWLPDYGIFLDNQVYQGRVGYRVYMPLRLAESDVSILIDRGWIAGGADRRRLPTIVTPVGTQDIEGVARARPNRFKELGPVYREGRVWENVTIERFNAWSGLKLQPVIVTQTGGTDDGLIRRLTTLDSGADRNRGYAVQWFAMAALTAILWAYYFFRRSTHAQ